jgi:hypothetical protein
VPPDPDCNCSNFPASFARGIPSQVALDGALFVMNSALF